MAIALKYTYIEMAALLITPAIIPLLKGISQRHASAGDSLLAFHKDVSVDNSVDIEHTIGVLGKPLRRRLILLLCYLHTLGQFHAIFSFKYGDLLYAN